MDLITQIQKLLPPTYNDHLNAALNWACDEINSKQPQRITWVFETPQHNFTKEKNNIDTIFVHIHKNTDQFKNNYVVDTISWPPQTYDKKKVLFTNIWPRKLYKYQLYKYSSSFLLLNLSKIWASFTVNTMPHYITTLDKYQVHVNRSSYIPTLQIILEILKLNENKTSTLHQDILAFIIKHLMSFGQPFLLLGRDIQHCYNMMESSQLTYYYEPWSQRCIFEDIDITPLFTRLYFVGPAIVYQVKINGHTEISGRYPIIKCITMSKFLTFILDIAEPKCTPIKSIVWWISAHPSYLCLNLFLPTLITDNLYTHPPFILDMTSIISKWKTSGSVQNIGLYHEFWHTYIHIHKIHINLVSPLLNVIDPFKDAGALKFALKCSKLTQLHSLHEVALTLMSVLNWNQYTMEIYKPVIIHPYTHTQNVVNSPDPSHEIDLILKIDITARLQQLWAQYKKHSPNFLCLRALFPIPACIEPLAHMAPYADFIQHFDLDMSYMALLYYALPLDFYNNDI